MSARNIIPVLERAGVAAILTNAWSRGWGVDLPLAIVSVLLHAGAGPRWTFHDAASGTRLGRSEGLALATLAMFEAGVFSGDRRDPLRADAAVLATLSADDIRRGYVVRVPMAYPMYDTHYAQRVEVIRGWLETIPNLVQIGRNGLHRYNNSDHSMLTAMRAVDNLLRGTSHDIWAVNAESAYHEEHEEPEQPYINVPEPPAMTEPLASESA